jgi:hypothetical protein
MTEIIADGGCMCGSVRYSVKGEVLWAGHCHCESCRRQTSSLMTSFFCVYEKNMMFVGDALQAYSPSKDVERGFCKNCGTPMYYMHASRPGEIDLYAVTLDNPENFKPKSHYHWDEKLSWLHVNDGLSKENQGE